MAMSQPVVWEIQVWSLGWEDPLEKEIATHCSILAWKIQWMEEPGSLPAGYSHGRLPCGRKESDMTEWLHFFLSTLHDISFHKSKNTHMYYMLYNHSQTTYPGVLICYKTLFLVASVVAQRVKNPIAIQQTWVWPLDWEDPLEEGMATRSSILAWRIPWIEESGVLWSIGSQRVGHISSDWAHTHNWYITL